MKYVSESFVSLRRLKTYLLQPELQDSPTKTSSSNSRSYSNDNNNDNDNDNEEKKTKKEEKKKKKKKKKQKKTKKSGDNTIDVHPHHGKTIISISQGEYRWNSSEHSTLKDINMKVKQGELIAIVGKRIRI